MADIGKTSGSTFKAGAASAGAAQAGAASAGAAQAGAASAGVAALMAAVVITFVVDSTASMGDAVEACKQTIIRFGSMLDMMKIKFEVIFFGDYDEDDYQLVNDGTGGRDTKYVVEVIDGDQLKVMIRLLRAYRLGKNGDGADCAEAFASAGHVLHRRVAARAAKYTDADQSPPKEITFWMTDAPPHGVDMIEERFFVDGQLQKSLCSVDTYPGRFERTRLSSLGLATGFKDVMELLAGARVSVNMLTVWRRYGDYHLKEDSILYTPENTDEKLRAMFNAEYGATRGRRHQWVPIPDFHQWCDVNRVKDGLTMYDTMNGLLIMMNILLVGGQFPAGVELPVGMQLPRGMQTNSNGEFRFPVDSLRDYYEKFVAQVTEFPQMIMYAPFLAGPYFDAVRKLKLTGEHGELCKKLKDMGIEQVVIDWFKEQGAPKLFLGDVNNDYLRQPELPFADFALVKSNMIPFKDLLNIIMFVSWVDGPGSIEQLRAALLGLRVVHLDSDEFAMLDGDYILLSAVAETPSILCSFLTYDKTDKTDETMKEFTSLNTIVVAAVLQWCGESAPQLVEIMQAFIQRPSFMAWTRRPLNVPDSIFNLPTLTFIRQALSAQETTADKEVLDRIMRTLRIHQAMRNTIAKLESMVALDTMRPNELAQNAPGVYQVMCPMIGKPFPINIFVLVNLDEIRRIRLVMENYIRRDKRINVFKSNKMFKKFRNFKTWSEYMDRIERLAEELNGFLLVSTYAKFFGEECRTGLPYVSADGVMDQFYWEKRIEKGGFNHRFDPADYNSIKEYYLKHIGFNAERDKDGNAGHGDNLINVANIIPKDKIQEGGCRMLSCSKKGRVRKSKSVNPTCGAVYMAADTTSGAVRAEAACAGCRNHAHLYNVKCKDCKTELAMGVHITAIAKTVERKAPPPGGAAPAADELYGETTRYHFSKENCVFCDIKGNVRGHENVPMAQLMKVNMDVFAGYFGIPVDLLQILVSTGKVAKTLRVKQQNAKNKEVIDDVLNDLVFDGAGWVKTRQNLEGLYHQGLLTKDGIATIDELIRSNFKLDCILCGDTVRTVDTTRCRECGFCFCNGCAHGMYSDQAWINQKQNAGNYSCPACRVPVQKGYARKFRYWVLYIALNDGIVQKALDTPKHEMVTCGKPGCRRTCVIELGNCEAAGADEDEDGAAAKDDDEPDYLECLQCKTGRIEAKHAEVLRLRALQDKPGVTLPNGIIITADGLLLRACPTCGLVGARDGACWNQHCVCGTSYPWCCGRTNHHEDVYSHLRRCTGGYGGQGHRDGGRHNPDLHLPADVLQQLNDEQRAAVEVALDRGGNLALPGDRRRPAAGAYGAYEDDGDDYDDWDEPY